MVARVCIILAELDQADMEAKDSNTGKKGNREQLYPIVAATDKNKLRVNPGWI